MSYSKTSTNGNNEISNLDATEKRINNISFDLIWSGSAYSALTNTLGGVLQKIDNVKASLNKYFDALELLEQYKQNKEKIASLKIQLFMLPDTEKYAAARASLASQIAALEAQNQSLKANITATMSSIVTIGSDVNFVSHEVSFDYLTSVEELLALYDYKITEEEKAAGIGFLRQLQGSARLDSYYNKVDENGNVIEGSGYEYITGILDSVKTTYSGREAAVNTALVLLKLASDKGVKLDYKHQGTNQNPYVSTAYVMNGVDCNPWTAYCVDKGTPTRFQWRPVTGFFDVGTGIPYENWSNAQPGDVMVNEGHVGIIIENDPDNNRFVVAEAKGQAVGIVLNYRSYNDLRGGGYSIRDMTNVYNGTENTDRACFEDRKESYKTTL